MEENGLVLDRRQQRRGIRDARKKSRYEYCGLLTEEN